MSSKWVHVLTHEGGTILQPQGSRKKELVQSPIAGAHGRLVL